jgi:hypothetical protein
MSPDEQQKRVRASFAKQGLMTTLGATLDSVSPGVVEIIVSPIRQYCSSMVSFMVEL